ncbi:MAG: hypothetical protein SCALA702_12590 [Melioribacteraceae bacterium]|nr:MAG: hypothetical protein SCALA702_12590 [Melioribacteraceae bacterium]
MKYFLGIILLLFAFGATSAQQTVKYVTYGKNARIVEGDNDYRQNIFIKIPRALGDTSLTLWGFDLDIGGDNDLGYGQFNTEMIYSLFGGEGVYSSFDPSKEKDINAVYSGTPLFTKTIASDESLNNSWNSLFRFDVKDGELKDGFYYFRFEIHGLTGDDANVYDISVGYANSARNKINGVRYFSYFVTTRLEDFFEYSSIKFNAPVNSAGIISNDFDAGGADLKINTPFRSIVIPKINNQGVWSVNRINLLPEEAGSECEIYFGKGGETPNDATFYMTDLEGNYLPLQLPVQIGKVNERPEVNYKIVPLADCYSIVFDAEASFDPDGNRLEFFWDFGDGNTATGARKVHRYESQREYNVVLMVKDNSGAVANSTLKNFSVKVNVPPVAAAGDDVVTFPGETVSFSAAGSNDEDGNIKEYKWEMGDGTNIRGREITYSYKAPGIFTVRLTVIDDSDSPCNTGVDEKTVRVNAAPVAVSSQPKMSAVGEQIAFSAEKSYDPDGEIIDYSWDFGDGNTGNGISVNHTYQSPGTYEVKLTISDESGVKNSIDTTFVPIIINNPPTAEAGDDRLVAVDELFVINGEGSVDSDGRIIRFDWDLGDGSTKSGYSVAHSYANPGKYTIKLKVRDDSNTKGNEDEDFLTVTVNARPAADAGDDFYVTYGRINFDASNSKDPDGNIVSYEWDFGDGQTGTGVNPAHIYKAPGEYNVSLRVTDNTDVQNNYDEDFIKVKINRVPLADAGPDEISAPGNEISFDGSNSFDTDGQIVRYVWEFGDGNSAEGVSVKHSYAKAGQYSVKLKVYDDSNHESAFDVDGKVITVNSPPVPFAGTDIVAAPGNKVVISGDGSYDIDGKITEYNWELSTGDYFVDPSFEYSFDSPGTYYAYLTVRDDADTYNSVKSDTVVIRVNSQPIAKAGSDIFTCENIITFDAGLSTDVDGDPLKYTWDFGDGSSPVQGLKVTHNYKEGGNYPVTLTVDDNKKLDNSVDRSSIVVKINKAPKADAGSDMIVCAGEPNLFNASNSSDPEGGVLLYKWDFGDGETAEGMNPTKIYNKGGVYQVKLTVEDDSGLPCNFDIDDFMVEVVESPVANAGSDMIVCANTEVKFDGTASKDYDGVVNAYEWDFGDGGYGGGAKPTYIYKKAGQYVVTLTITGDLTPGCDNTDSDDIIVTVIEAPVAVFEIPERHPVNIPLDFDGSASSGEGSSIVKYSWDFGDGNTAEGSNVNHTYTEAGNYFVTLEVTTDSETKCNNAVFREMITVNSAPVAEAGDDMVVTANEVVIFNGSNSVDSDGVIKKYSWDFGDGTTGEGMIVKHQYSSSGTYEVSLFVEDNTSLSNNSASDKLTVFVNSPPEPVISAPAIVCVNEAFTLNGAGSRDSDNQIVTHNWYLPDGEVKTGETVEHTFNFAGSYSVRLEVVDNSGAADSSVSTTKLIKVNTLPAAALSTSRIVIPGEEVTFSAKGSSDPDFDLLSYRWETGDGSTLEGESVKYVYQTSGAYTVTLTVDDRTGTECAVVTEEFDIVVNSAPSAIITAPDQFKIGPANSKVLLSAASSSDTDGDNLTYKWEFQNGTIKEGAEVLYEFTSPGTYTVRLSVDDGKNAKNSVSIVEKLISVEYLK